MKTMTSKIYLILLVAITASATFANNNSSVIVPPENDYITDAVNLNMGPLPYTEVNVNFTEATFTGDGGSEGCNNVVPAIWYKFTATANGSVTAFIETPLNPLTIFYTAPNDNVTSASELTYVDQPSNYCAFNNFSTIETTEGTVYYLLLRNEINSTVAINVSEAFARPVNDIIILATEVDLNNPTNNYNNIHFLTATNGTDSGQEGCDSDEVAGIWYKFYSENEMQIEANISSNASVSALIIYTGDDGNAIFGSQVSFVDQPGNICGLANSTEITTDADTWYYIFAATAEPYANITISNSILGITENTIDGFSFYPNPINNQLNLSAKSNIEKVALYNINGQKVYSDKVNALQKTINLSFLQSGLYVMHIISDGISASYKVIKQ